MWKLLESEIKMSRWEMCCENWRMDEVKYAVHWQARMSGVLNKQVLLLILFTVLLTFFSVVSSVI
jgi:hypothetical protein